MNLKQVQVPAVTFYHDLDNWRSLSQKSKKGNIKVRKPQLLNSLEQITWN